MADQHTHSGLVVIGETDARLQMVGSGKGQGGREGAGGAISRSEQTTRWTPSPLFNVPFIGAEAFRDGAIASVRDM